MIRPVRHCAAAAATLVLAAGLVGCSSTDSISQGDLEEKISTELTEEVGQEPDDISCPGDLEAEEGKTIECTLTAGEDELGVTVEVTEADGGDYKLDIQVDDQIK